MKNLILDAFGAFVILFAALAVFYDVRLSMKSKGPSLTSTLKRIEIEIKNKNAGGTK